MSLVFLFLTATLDSLLLLSSVYLPNSELPVSRPLNITQKATLRLSRSIVLSTGIRYINHKRLQFAEALDMVLFGYRSTVYVTTGNSPSYLTYGVDPRLAPELACRTNTAESRTFEVPLLSPP